MPVNTHKFSSACVLMTFIPSNHTQYIFHAVTKFSIHTVLPLTPMLLYIFIPNPHTADLCVYSPFHHCSCITATLTPQPPLTPISTTQGVPPTEHAEDQQAEQGPADAPHECRAGETEGAGEDRKGETAATHAGG